MSLVKRTELDSPDRRERTTEVLAKIDEQGLRYVRAAYPDLMGVLRGRVVRADRLKEIFEEGPGFGARLLISDAKQEIDPSIIRQCT